MATKSPHHTLRASTDTSISIDDAGPPLTIVGRAPNTRNIEQWDSDFDISEPDINLGANNQPQGQTQQKDHFSDSEEGDSVDFDGVDDDDDLEAEFGAYNTHLDSPDFDDMDFGDDDFGNDAPLAPMKIDDEFDDSDDDSDVVDWDKEIELETQSTDNPAATQPTKTNDVGQSHGTLDDSSGLFDEDWDHEIEEENGDDEEQKKLKMMLMDEVIDDDDDDDATVGGSSTSNPQNTPGSASSSRYNPNNSPRLANTLRNSTMSTKSGLNTSGTFSRGASSRSNTSFTAGSATPLSTSTHTMKQRHRGTGTNSSMVPKPTMRQDHKLISSNSASGGSATVVLYPPPSYLYSIKTSRPFVESSMESWLRDLAQKHVPPPDPEPFVFILPTINDNFSMYRYLSYVLKHCVLMFRRNEYQDVWDVVTSIFAFLDAWQNHPRVWQIRDQPAVWPIIHDLLFLVSKIWNADVARGYYTLIQIAKTVVMPTYARLIELIEAETVAHHDGSQANKLIRTFVRIYLRVSDVTSPSSTTIPSTLTTNTSTGTGSTVGTLRGREAFSSFSKHVGATKNTPLVSLFPPAPPSGDDPEEQIRAQFTSPPNEEMLSLEASLRALTDLHLYLTGISPLSGAPLSSGAEWDEESLDFEWLELAWQGEAPTPQTIPECALPPSQYRGVHSQSQSSSSGGSGPNSPIPSSSPAPASALASLPVPVPLPLPGSGGNGPTAGGSPGRPDSNINTFTDAPGSIGSVVSGSGSAGSSPVLTISPPPVPLAISNPLAWRQEVMVWKLCGPPDMRIGLMYELYLKLRPDFSWTKAKAAFALGRHEWFVDDAVAAEDHVCRAESLLYEALFILDNLPKLPLDLDDLFTEHLLNSPLAQQCSFPNVTNTSGISGTGNGSAALNNTAANVTNVANVANFAGSTTGVVGLSHQSGMTTNASPPPPFHSHSLSIDHMRSTGSVATTCDSRRHSLTTTAVSGLGVETQSLSEATATASFHTATVDYSLTVAHTAGNGNTGSSTLSNGFAVYTPSGDPGLQTIAVNTTTEDTHSHASIVAPPVPQIPTVVSASDAERLRIEAERMRQEKERARAEKEFNKVESEYMIVCSLPMLSELACQTLQLHGDVLLALNKYRYAIHAFEAALRNYSYRRGSDMQSLIRRLCELCTVQDDIPRAIKYHARMLSNAVGEGNLDTYVFVTQEITKIYAKVGKYEKAEEHLRAALCFLFSLIKPQAQAVARVLLTQRSKFRDQAKSAAGGAGVANKSFFFDDAENPNTREDNFRRARWVIPSAISNPYAGAMGMVIGTNMGLNYWSMGMNGYNSGGNPGTHSFSDSLQHPAVGHGSMQLPAIPLGKKTGFNLSGMDSRGGSVRENRRKPSISLASAMNGVNGGSNGSSSAPGSVHGFPGSSRSGSNQIMHMSQMQMQMQQHSMTVPIAEESDNPNSGMSVSGAPPPFHASGSSNGSGLSGTHVKGHGTVNGLTAMNISHADSEASLPLAGLGTVNNTYYPSQGYSMGYDRTVSMIRAGPGASNLNSMFLDPSVGHGYAHGNPQGGVQGQSMTPSQLGTSLSTSSSAVGEPVGTGYTASGGVPGLTFPYPAPGLGLGMHSYSTHQYSSYPTSYPAPGSTGQQGGSGFGSGVGVFYPHPNGNAKGGSISQLNPPPPSTPSNTKDRVLAAVPIWSKGVFRILLTPASEIKTSIANLVIMLGRLYLSADKVIYAISLLESLRPRERDLRAISAMGSSGSDESSSTWSILANAGWALPKAKLAVVDMLLATAYMKAHMFLKASRVMNSMETPDVGFGPGGDDASTRSKEKEKEKEKDKAKSKEKDKEKVTSPLPSPANTANKKDDKKDKKDKKKDDKKDKKDKKGEKGGSVLPPDAIAALQTTSDDDHTIGVPKKPAVPASAVLASATPTASTGGGKKPTDVEAAFFSDDKAVDGTADGIMSTEQHISTPEYMETRAKTAYFAGDHVGALRLVTKALSLCPPSSFHLLGKFNYRKGLIHQDLLRVQLERGNNDLALSQLGNVMFSPMPKSNSGSNGKQDPLLLPDPRMAVSALSTAYQFFERSDDRVRMAKCLLHICETYLHVAFIAIAVLNHPVRQIVPWFKMAGFSVRITTADKEDEDAMYSLDDFLNAMESYINTSITTAHRAFLPMILLRCQLCCAEIHILRCYAKSKKSKFADHTSHVRHFTALALLYWREASESFSALFINHDQVVLSERNITSEFLRQFRSLFQQLIRVLMTFNPVIINANLSLLDAFMLFETSTYAYLAALFQQEALDENRLAAANNALTGGSKEASLDDPALSWMAHAGYGSPSPLIISLLQYSEGVAFKSSEFANKIKLLRASYDSQMQLVRAHQEAEKRNTRRKIILEQSFINERKKHQATGSISLNAGQTMPSTSASNLSSTPAQASGDSSEIFSSMLDSAAMSFGTRKKALPMNNTMALIAAGKGVSPTLAVGAGLGLGLGLSALGSVGGLSNIALSPGSIPPVGRCGLSLLLDVEQSVDFLQPTGVDDKDSIESAENERSVVWTAHVMQITELDAYHRASVSGAGSLAGLSLNQGMGMNGGTGSNYGGTGVTSGSGSSSGGFFGDSYLNTVSRNGAGGGNGSGNTISGIGGFGYGTTYEFGGTVNANSLAGVFGNGTGSGSGMGNDSTTDTFKIKSYRRNSEGTRQFTTRARAKANMCPPVFSADFVLGPVFSVDSRFSSFVRHRPSTPAGGSSQRPQRDSALRMPISNFTLGLLSGGKSQRSVSSNSPNTAVSSGMMGLSSSPGANPSVGSDSGSGTGHAPGSGAGSTNSSNSSGTGSSLGTGSVHAVDSVALRFPLEAPQRLYTGDGSVEALANDISNRICFLLREMERRTEQCVAGNGSLDEVGKANRDLFEKMVLSMDRIRHLTLTPQPRAHVTGLASPTDVAAGVGTTGALAVRAAVDDALLARRQALLDSARGPLQSGKGAFDDDPPLSPRKSSEMLATVTEGARMSLDRSLAYSSIAASSCPQCARLGALENPYSAFTSLEPSSMGMGMMGMNGLVGGAGMGGMGMGGMGMGGMGTAGSNPNSPGSSPSNSNSAAFSKPYFAAAAHAVPPLSADILSACSPNCVANLPGLGVFSGLYEKPASGNAVHGSCSGSASGTGQGQGAFSLGSGVSQGLGLAGASMTGIASMQGMPGFERTSDDVIWGNPERSRLNSNSLAYMIVIDSVLIAYLPRTSRKLVRCFTGSDAIYDKQKNWNLNHVYPSTAFAHSFLRDLYSPPTSMGVMGVPSVPPPGYSQILPHSRVQPKFDNVQSAVAGSILSTISQIPLSHLLVSTCTTGETRVLSLNTNGAGASSNLGSGSGTGSFTGNTTSVASATGNGGNGLVMSTTLANALANSTSTSANVANTPSAGNAFGRSSHISPSLNVNANIFGTSINNQLSAMTASSTSVAGFSGGPLLLPNGTSVTLLPSPDISSVEALAHEAIIADANKNCPYVTVVAVDDCLGSDGSPLNVINGVLHTATKQLISSGTYASVMGLGMSTDSAATILITGSSAPMAPIELGHARVVDVYLPKLYDLAVAFYNQHMHNSYMVSVSQQTSNDHSKKREKPVSMKMKDFKRTEHSPAYFRRFPLSSVNMPISMPYVAPHMFLSSTDLHSSATAPLTISTTHFAQVMSQIQTHIMNKIFSNGSGEKDGRPLSPRNPSASISFKGAHVRGPSNAKTISIEQLQQHAGGANAFGTQNTNKAASHTVPSSVLHSAKGQGQGQGHGDDDGNGNECDSIVSQSTHLNTSATPRSFRGPNSNAFNSLQNRRAGPGAIAGIHSLPQTHAQISGHNSLSRNSRASDVSTSMQSSLDISTGTLGGKNTLPGTNTTNTSGGVSRPTLSRTNSHSTSLSLGSSHVDDSGANLNAHAHSHNNSSGLAPGATGSGNSASNLYYGLNPGLQGSSQHSPNGTLNPEHGNSSGHHGMVSTNHTSNANTFGFGNSQGNGQGQGQGQVPHVHIRTPYSIPVLGMTIPQKQPLVKRIAIKDSEDLLPPPLEMNALYELMNCLNTENLVNLFAAIMCESRIVLVSSSSFRIKSVIDSMLALVYPFKWQNMCIPLLSRHCGEILQQRRPYIIGVNSLVYEAIVNQQHFATSFAGRVKSSPAANNVVVTSADDYGYGYGSGPQGSAGEDHGEREQRDASPTMTSSSPLLTPLNLGLGFGMSGGYGVSGPSSFFTPSVNSSGVPNTHHPRATTYGLQPASNHGTERPRSFFSFSSRVKNNQAGPDPTSMARQNGVSVGLQPDVVFVDLDSNLVKCSPGSIMPLPDKIKSLLNKAANVFRAMKFKAEIRRGGMDAPPSRPKPPQGPRPGAAISPTRAADGTSLTVPGLVRPMGPGVGTRSPPNFVNPQAGVSKVIGRSGAGDCDLASPVKTEMPLNGTGSMQPSPSPWLLSPAPTPADPVHPDNNSVTQLRNAFLEANLSLFYRYMLFWDKSLSPSQHIPPVTSPMSALHLNQALHSAHAQAHSQAHTLSHITPHLNASTNSVASQSGKDNGNNGNGIIPGLNRTRSLELPRSDDDGSAIFSHSTSLSHASTGSTTNTNANAGTTAMSGSSTNTGNITSVSSPSPAPTRGHLSPAFVMAGGVNHIHNHAHGQSQSQSHVYSTHASNSSNSSLGPNTGNLSATLSAILAEDPLNPNSPHLRSLITSASSVVSQVSMQSAADWYTALDFDMEGFLRATKQQYRPFVRVVCRSGMFRHFLTVRHRLRGIPACMYLFDQWAAIRVHNKWTRRISLWRHADLPPPSTTAAASDGVSTRANALAVSVPQSQMITSGSSLEGGPDDHTIGNTFLEALCCGDSLQFARSEGRFHRRYVEIVTRDQNSRILVYKDVVKGTGPGAIPKHDRLMLSTLLKVQGPASEKLATASSFSFSLLAALTPEVIRAVLISNQAQFVPAGMLLLQKKAAAFGAALAAANGLTPNGIPVTGNSSNRLKNASFSVSMVSYSDTPEPQVGTIATIASPQQGGNSTATTRLHGASISAVSSGPVVESAANLSRGDRGETPLQNTGSSSPALGQQQASSLNSTSASQVLTPDENLLIASLDHVTIAIGQSPVQALISRVRTVEDLKKLVALNELAAVLLGMSFQQTPAGVVAIEESPAVANSSADAKSLIPIPESRSPFGRSRNYATITTVQAQNANQAVATSPQVVELATAPWPITVEKLIQFANEWERGLLFKADSQYQRNRWSKILEARLLTSDQLLRYSAFQ